MATFETREKHKSERQLNPVTISLQQIPLFSKLFGAALACLRIYQHPLFTEPFPSISSRNSQPSHGAASTASQVLKCIIVLWLWSLAGCRRTGYNGAFLLHLLQPWYKIISWNSSQEYTIAIWSHSGQSKAAHITNCS